MIKFCLKCNNSFSSIYKDESGKSHNLQRRKFCLSCSPYGNHNTSNLIKPKTNYTHSRDYQVMSPEERKSFNKKTSINIQKRRLKRKLELVLIKGGKCQKCNYNKNYSALQFHHRNPQEKLFQLDSRNIGAKNWLVLLAEAEKCDLLCGNCHAEHHYPQCQMVVSDGGASVNERL